MYAIPFGSKLYSLYPILLGTYYNYSKISHETRAAESTATPSYINLADLP